MHRNLLASSCCQQAVLQVCDDTSYHTRHNAAEQYWSCRQATVNSCHMLHNLAGGSLNYVSQLTATSQVTSRHVSSQQPACMSVCQGAICGLGADGMDNSVMHVLLVWGCRVGMPGRVGICASHGRYCKSVSQLASSGSV